MRMSGLLAGLLLVWWALSACSTQGPARDDADQTVPVSAQAAADFGELTVPEGVEILGTDADFGRDTRYRLALRMNEAQLRDFLRQFTHALQRSDIPKSTPVIAGLPLSSAPAPLYAQDQITTPDHGTVTREVIVDERAPDQVYVHLSLYTT